MFRTSRDRGPSPPYFGPDPLPSRLHGLKSMGSYWCMLYSGCFESGKQPGPRPLNAPNRKCKPGPGHDTESSKTPSEASRLESDCTAMVLHVTTYVQYTLYIIMHYTVYTKYMIRIHEHIHLHIHIHIQMHIHLQMYTFVYMYMRILSPNTYMYMYLLMLLAFYKYQCIYVYTHASVCVDIYTHMYMYIYIYVYTNAYAPM